MEIDKEKLRPFLVLVERFLKSKKWINQSQFKDEFDKIFNCIIQGKDVVNAFERRDMGISDEEWDQALRDFFKGLGKNADF